MAGLQTLVAASPMGHQSSSDGVSNLMLEFKVPSNAKSGAPKDQRGPTDAAPAPER